jgi:hypothetical protein
MFMLFFVEVSFFEFILKKAVTNNYLIAIKTTSVL